MNNNYSMIEDFVDDQSFLSWVFKTNKKDMADWELWLNNNPAKIQMANEAASVIKFTRIKDVAVSEQQLADAETRLRLSIKADHAPVKVINIVRRRIWYSVAAVLLISLAFALSLIFHSPEKSQLATNYGQV